MRLIDADKLMRFFTVDTANQTYRFGTIKKQIENAETVQAIPIPDNATNGDVVLVIFKEIQHYSDGKICADWWNAPYKRGDEA